MVTQGKKGLIHIYTGEGKGKTTASVGLAVRGAGSGLKVLFVQFFKPEADPSGEKDVLRSIDGIEVLRGKERHPFFTGKKADEEAIRKDIRALFKEAVESSSEGVDMLVMDEFIGAVNKGYISVEEALEFMDDKPGALEVVLTGRDASPLLASRADYVTEMIKIKHPFDDGIDARRGIEY